MSSAEYKSIKMRHRIIQHLGKDLITTSDVAITELLKNSIDAKAKDIRIHIVNKFSDCVANNKRFIIKYNSSIEKYIPQDLYNKAVCIIEDSGNGMNEFQLDAGFLTIGTDIKKKEQSMMFGEKGIGRLAAQRLGGYLLIETASRDETFSNVVFIDWNASISGENEIKVPYYQTEKMSNHYTRLWIFGIDLSDFIETPVQLIDEQDDLFPVIVDRNLKSSINFLISPFSKVDIAIDMYLGEKKLDIAFPDDLLELSESKHAFDLCIDNNRLTLGYQLIIKPWYAERVHRSLVKSEAFKKLKKPHSFYRSLLDDNCDRIKNVLIKNEDEDTLKKVIFDYFMRQYKDLISDKEYREDYVTRLVENTIENLKKIAPISGEIFTFKQGITIGERIIVSSVNEIRKEDKKTLLSLDALSSFLAVNNGVKLYRDNYRIGFLGNRESDWLNLQQYSTKGQQYYRLDPSSTIGFVSVHDTKQAYIQEISSRLDISQNEVSKSFKTFINIVFNRLFYSLNRQSNNILKVILEEQGVLNRNLGEEIKKNTYDIEKFLKQGKDVYRKLENVFSLLNQGTFSLEQPFITLLETEVLDMKNHLQQVGVHLKEEQKTQKQTLQILHEADEQLKAVEVEAYNNYKLMANGLITETITHELDSVCRTSDPSNMEPHFDNIQRTLLKCQEVRTISDDLKPIRKSFYSVANKMEEVADLYNFIEKTFIRRGVYDEFENQNIKNLIEGIEKNLIELKKERIVIECLTGELCWLVPKGVLIHVFYNLFINSIYWIDVRRKYALDDGYYAYEGPDKIVIESLVPDEIVVYDTGTGVQKVMEDILFQPLESGKEYNTGRGMGLYIVQQLLRSFSADIWLDSERNKYGNRFKFVISLNQEG